MVIDKYKNYCILEVRKGNFVPQYTIYLFGFIPVRYYLDYFDEYDLLLLHKWIANVENYCESKEEAEAIIEKHIENKQYPILHKIEK